MEKKDYKDTLNLPRTDFPMKADLPRREPKFLSFWAEHEVYEKMLEKNRNKSPYILHDGPPYANGHIHIGHALNKILKDMIVKYKAMRGRYAPYVPGWDCHGLPIENEVDKKLGRKKAEVGVVEKRELCRKYAEEFVGVQREEFKRLGVLGDWEKPYLTMTHGYEGAIIREFMEFLKRGFAYKGKKPVYWCPSCITALAEAEVEYADKESPSIYVKFKLDKAEAANKLKLEGKDAFIVIWTTTPWTLPANLALAVKSNINYAAVMTLDQKEFLIVAEDLVLKLHHQGILPTNNVYRTFTGADMKGLSARHPFIERDSKVILGEFVTVGEGTGIVHIAPGHGEDDYEAGRREGLDIYAPVDDRGKFSGSGVPEIEGQFVFEANKTVIELLKQTNALLHEEKLLHSYPHCWRCKRPVIFRATEQWFISVEHEGLRGKCLSEIDRVRWVPEWGKDRIKGMVTTRPDWCISRQRAWGVPIAVFRCAKCGEFLKDEEVLGGVIRLFEREGSDAWFKKSAKEILPEGAKCARCGGGEFSKEVDILDVWFESGVSHAAVLLSGAYIRLLEDADSISGSSGSSANLISGSSANLSSGSSANLISGSSANLSSGSSANLISGSSANLISGSSAPLGAPWPADMYLEGSDQHRGWFQSSLLASVGTRGTAPYRTVLTHGFVVDGQGKKMSKSLGNVVAPQDVIKATGAEILRLWVSAEDYRGDIRISKEILARLTEAYRKIRNTARFMLGNLSDFTPPVNEDIKRGGEIEGGYEIDRWAMSRLQGLVRDVTASYESFDFHEVYHRIYNFCVVDMSAFYLDILKDRLYTFKGGSPERRAAQGVLNEVLMTMTRLMAPVLSFTAEEIWQSVKDRPSGSVFLSDFPEVDERYIDAALEERWQRLIAIRDEVNKALELKRAEKFIGNSLEARLLLYARGEEVSLLREREDFLPSLFIVSQVELMERGEGERRSEAIEGFSVTVLRAEGRKCERCWNWSKKVGTYEDAPEVCGRCHEVIN